MAGVMFWQSASDPKEYLLDAINENLYPQAFFAAASWC